MAGIFKKIQSAAKNRTTYRVGLLQAKAYRILKSHTAKALEPYNLSTVDWALLGLLYDARAGMRSMDLALELGVEAPFITSLYTKLHKAGLISSRKGDTDSRVKHIFLTPVGVSLVDTIESSLRSHMRELISGARMGDLLSYVSVLETITENAKKK